MNKKDPISHFGLALDHFHLSKMDEALKELDRSLDLDPEQFSAHYAAAQINKQLYLNSPGDIQRAQQMIEHFEKADRISPGNPEIQFNIGLGYYYQRNCANASDNFLRALKNPSLDDDSRLLAKKYLNECSSQ